jgi:hypothetical protein
MICVADRKYTHTDATTKLLIRISSVIQGVHGSEKTEPFHIQVSYTTYIVHKIFYIHMTETKSKQIKLFMHINLTREGLALSIYYNML